MLPPATGDPVLFAGWLELGDVPVVEVGFSKWSVVVVSFVVVVFRCAVPGTDRALLPQADKLMQTIRKRRPTNPTFLNSVICDNEPFKFAASGLAQTHRT